MPSTINSDITDDGHRKLRSDRKGQSPGSSVRKIPAKHKYNISQRYINYRDLQCGMSKSSTVKLEKVVIEIKQLKSVTKWSENINITQNGIIYCSESNDRAHWYGIDISQKK